MNNYEYQKLYKLETTYWWHVGRRQILKTLIRKFVLPTRRNKQILDAGCGTGETTKFLSQFGKVTGIDASKQAIEFCKTRKLRNIWQSTAENLPFEEGFFDLITMLDLLEHIENSTQALKESYRVLKAGGFLLITVPAHQSLWSGHDVALHHKRRYSKKQLKTAIESAGFTVKKISFAVTILFLPILGYRTLQKIFFKNKLPQTSYVILPDWLNTTFINLLKLEAWVLKYGNLPFGTSLICIAEKK